MNTTEELSLARQLITNAQRWTRGSFAAPSEDGGMAFCAAGALIVAHGDTNFLPNADGMDYWPSVNLLAQCMPDWALLHAEVVEALGQAGSVTRRIMRFNDGALTHHEDVLELFDRAIARSKLIDIMADAGRTEIETSPARELEPA